MTEIISRASTLFMHYPAIKPQHEARYTTSRHPAGGDVNCLVVMRGAFHEHDRFLLRAPVTEWLMRKTDEETLMLPVIPHGIWPKDHAYWRWAIEAPSRPTRYGPNVAYLLNDGQVKWSKREVEAALLDDIRPPQTYAHVVIMLRNDDPYSDF